MANSNHSWVVVTRMTDDKVRFFVKDAGGNTETSNLSEAHGWHYKKDAKTEADRLGLMHTNIGRRSWFASR